MLLSGAKVKIYSQSDAVRIIFYVKQSILVKKIEFTFYILSLNMV